MTDKEPFWDRKNGYGILLSEYKGNYSLVAGKETEGVQYKDWVYLSKWSKAEGGFVADDKKRPMNVYLGNKEEAVKALKFFLAEIEGPTEENVPF